MSATRFVRTIAVIGASAVAVTAFARGRVDKTVWDGVYTTAQAQHGDSLFQATCDKCHGEKAANTPDDGGRLVGKDFLADFDGLALSELYTKIYTTMPSDKPKSLQPKDVADVMAYLLAQNQFPAGSVALVENADSLKTIKVVAAKP